MRGRDLDELLGDPHDPANPVGYTAVLAADERRERLADGETLLHRAGLNAEFVPAALGGRFERADRLAEVLRTLWRRDPCLGAGYGFSSFLASVNVWCAGDEGQRRKAADLLLDGRRISVAFHELAHGNDFAQAEFAARPAGTGTGNGNGSGAGWLLSGRKEVVANLARADALVVFARTSEATGSRSHSQFLVVKDEVPADRWRTLPRFATSGMSGLSLDGMAFDDCPIGADTLIGGEGRGIEVALRAFQTTRAMLPAMCAGSLDTALRVAFAFAAERRLYGGTVADIPYVRSALARAFADLLAVDAFSAVVLRALHLAPEAAPVYASASKYLGPRMLADAFDDLRAVLGAQGYLRQGPHAMFQKLARDAAPMIFTHASRAACLATILPQLPRLARRSWLADPAGPDGLFDLEADLPPLCFDALAVGMPRGDDVIGVLTEAQDPETSGGLDDAFDGELVARFATRFAAELRALRAACAELPPGELTMDAEPATFALAAKYTVLLAAASALAVWRRAPGRYPAAALPAVLDRLAGRLGGAAVLTPDERERVESVLFPVAAARFADRRLFDLTARRIPG